MTDFLRLALAMSMAGLSSTPWNGLEQTLTTGASVSGVVIADENQPVPRAVVTLAGAGLVAGRTSVITDDSGRFEFVNVPAGRFALTAARASFVTGQFGAATPGETGTMLSLTSSSRLSNLTIRLWRGGILSGLVRDESGRPVTGVRIVPSRIDASRGTTSADVTTSTGELTDVRGEFRIFGLPPGTYLLAAVPSDVDSEPIEAPSEREVDEVLRRLRGRLPIENPQSPRVQVPLVQTLSHAPVFFPGTTSLQTATRLEVGPGQELAGLNFTFQPTQTYVIDGRVTTPDGLAASGTPVEMMTVAPADVVGVGLGRLRTATGPDGRFRFERVVPGEYRLVARYRDPVGPGAAVDGADTLWAQATVSSYAGQEVALQLERGVVMRGHVVVSGGRSASLRVRVSLMSSAAESASLQPTTSLITSPSTLVASDGTFVLAGILPGSYRVNTIITGPNADDMWVERATSGGRDLLDGPSDLRGDVRDVVISITNVMSELSGNVELLPGVPASEIYVLVAPVDRQFWTRSERRVRIARPDTDGHYSIKALPQGRYLVGAVLQASHAKMTEVSFLEQLAQQAIQQDVSGRTILNIRLAGSPSR